MFNHSEFITSIESKSGGSSGGSGSGDSNSNNTTNTPTTTTTNSSVAKIRRIACKGVWPTSPRDFIVATNRCVLLVCVISMCY